MTEKKKNYLTFGLSLVVIVFVALLPPRPSVAFKDPARHRKAEGAKLFRVYPDIPAVALEDKLNQLAAEGYLIDGETIRGIGPYTLIFSGDEIPAPEDQDGN
jgi:hypothetical protein